MFDTNQVVCLYVYNLKSDSTEGLIQRSVEMYRKRYRIKDIDLPIIIERTSKGKPFLKEGSNTFVSVTHSGEYCIIGVATQELGIDLQSHARLQNENLMQATERYLRLSKRFFHPNENEYIVRDPNTRFFDVWCAKESYVKYTGSGIDDSFGTTNILPLDTSKRVTVWNAVGVYFQLVEFKSAYTVCVCTKYPVTVRVTDYAT